MLLAPDDIVIQHGGNSVRLTPSLRAACRLNSKHGVTKLFNSIAEGRLGVVLDILAEGGVDLSKPSRMALFGTSLRDTLESLKEPLFRFLGICFGADDSGRTADKADNKLPDVEAGLVTFYEIGTGWLGWTPAETWAATPSEILAAQRGHVAKLKAIFGTAEKDASGHKPTSTVYSAERLAEIDQQGHDPAFDRAGFHAFKAKIARDS